MIVSNVPYDTQVAYLESTGTQYIDTGFKPNQDTRIIATMQCVTSTSYGRLFGSGTRNSLNSIMIDYETGITGTLHVKYGNNSNWTNVSSIYGDYETHTYDFNKNNLYIDRKLVSSNTYGTFQSTSNLGIFTYINGNYVGQSTEFFIGRLYSFQIYDNDVLVRDYIPVRVNETGYLYDKVSKELFSNAGTGDFILGNDLSNINVNGFVSSFRRRLLSTYRAPLPDYLCFTALEDGTFTFTIYSGVDTTDCEYIEYSTDGKTWNRTNNVASTTVTITTPTILEGKKVYWRGYGYRYCPSNNDSYASYFSSTGTFNVSGKISSIILGPDFESATQYRRRYATNHSGNRSALRALFKDCTGLVDASGLILPNIGYNYNFGFYYALFTGCTSLIDASFELPTVVTENNNGGNYGHMFYGCSSLISPPVFNMSDCKADDFNGTFYNCTSLTIAPDISSITSLASGCFAYMFYGCSGITQPAKMNQFTTVTKDCFFGMYCYCTSLTTAPVLPAETLATNCYYFMFIHCSNLTWVKMLATDIPASGYLQRWMDSVKNTSDCIFIKHIDATWTTTGSSGVPTNWTVIYYDPDEDKYYTDQTKATECDDHGNFI